MKGSGFGEMEVVGGVGMGTGEEWVLEKRFLRTGCEVPAFGGGGAEPVFQQAAACGGFGVGVLV